MSDDTGTYGPLGTSSEPKSP